MVTMIMLSWFYSLQDRSRIPPTVVAQSEGGDMNEDGPSADMPTSAASVTFDGWAVESTQPAEPKCDWSRVEGYLRKNFPGLDSGFRVTRFAGGRANLTYLVSIGSDRFVVRRPPMGDLAP